MEWLSSLLTGLWSTVSGWIGEERKLRKERREFAIAQCTEVKATMDSMWKYSGPGAWKASPPDDLELRIDNAYKILDGLKLKAQSAEAKEAATELEKIFHCYVVAYKGWRMRVEHAKNPNMSAELYKIHQEIDDLDNKMSQLGKDFVRKREEFVNLMYKKG